MISKEIRKVINEYTKYFTFTPPNHTIIRPLNAINTDVPGSGWEITNIIGTSIFVKTNKMLVKVFTFSIFIRW
jgi:hypothetical protein